MTGSAPTFLSAISWIASKTVASGAIDQTAGFFRAKSTPTVPAPAIPVGMWPIQRQDSKWKNCTPVDLRCPVTLKVISERYLGDESAQLRFLREARAAASVRHPNVASVFHLGRTGSSYFYAMEFVGGETLESLIRRSGRVEMKLALEITTQVAAGLDAVHEQSLVHRDIKPSNIMVRLRDDGS